jgi:hypothetical protein
LEVEVIEIPAWEITRDRVESLHASVVLVPHRCRFDFEAGKTPVLFFMQEYFRWLFVIDPSGWSASSSVYPIDADDLPKAVEGGAFDEYRRRLAAGDLQSKFAQPARRVSKQRSAVAASRASHLCQADERWDPLRARWIRLGSPLDGNTGGNPEEGRLREDALGELVPSVFFPMQIPHDQSIRYFSDFEFDAVLEAVVQWAQQVGVVVKLKAHPANMPLMKKYLDRYPESTWVRWRDENIHDLIAESDAVFTVNSGVGFEALLHSKPVVTFGRAEYDCVTVHATPQDVNAAWVRCRESYQAEREKRYRDFFDWFMTDHAVDLSRPAAADLRLVHWAATIAAIARKAEQPREPSIVDEPNPT